MLDQSSFIAQFATDIAEINVQDASDKSPVLFQSTETLDVYCRADCPSLRPHRDTARGFASRTEAIDAGLRPCGWCRPDAGRPAGGPRPSAARRARHMLADLFGALVFLP